MTSRPYRLVALVLLFVTACSRTDDPAAPPPDLAPQFGTAGDDRASIVVADPQRGRVYLAGTANASLETYTRGTPFFRSYDRSGRLVWERRMSRPGSVTGAAVGPDGSVLFSWQTTKSFVTKYSPAGTRLFQLVLRDVGVDGLTTDRSGNVYVAGGRDYSEPRFARKYTPTGKLVWEKRLAIGFDEDVGPPMLGVSDLAATPDGSLYLAGRSVDDYGYLVKLRGSDGTVLGHEQLSGGSGLEIEASGNDAIYLRTAYEDVLDGGSDYNVYKFRSDLSIAWVGGDLVSANEGGNRRDDPEDDTYGLSTDASGNVYLTGVYFSAATDETDYFVRKLSAAGSLLFDRRVAVPESNAAGYGIAALGSGELYLVGATGGRVNGKNYGGEDAFLIRTDGQGREVWAR